MPARRNTTGKLVSSSRSGRQPPADRASARGRPVFPQKRTLALVLLAAFVLGAGLYPVSILQIEERRRERTVFVALLPPGAGLSLGYRHSVELSPVWDHFRIDKTQGLILTETVFSSSNTGLPAILAQGERLTRGPEAFRIAGMHRILPAVEIWVDRRYGNTLALAGREIPLADLAGDTLLRLQVRRVMLAQWACRKTQSLLNRLSKESR